MTLGVRKRIIRKSLFKPKKSINLPQLNNEFRTQFIIALHPQKSMVVNALNLKEEAIVKFDAGESN